MIILKILNRIAHVWTCRHRHSVIKKYGPNGTRLPLNEHFHACIDCGKSLNYLTYLDK